MKSKSTIKREMARLQKVLDTPDISDCLRFRAVDSYYALVWAISNKRLEWTPAGEAEKAAEAEGRE